MKRLAFVSGILVLLLGSSIAAATIPGRWEKVESLDRGSAIVLYLKSGDRLETTFQGLTESTVRIQSDLEHPRSNIQRLSVQIADNLSNGTLIGTGVGFGVGFLATVAWERSETASGFRLEEEALGLAFLGGAIGAGAGALIGWAIDRRNKAEEVLYEAP